MSIYQDLSERDWSEGRGGLGADPQDCSEPSPLLPSSKPHSHPIPRVSLCLSFLRLAQAPALRCLRWEVLKNEAQVRLIYRKGEPEGGNVLPGSIMHFPQQ